MAGEELGPFGDQDEVAWIQDGFAVGLTVKTAIPPDFDTYATIVLPDTSARSQAEAAALCRTHAQRLIDLLHRQPGSAQWWLGYLETGLDHLIPTDAPKVSLYAGWNYLLVKGDADRALNLRTVPDSSHPLMIPELLFPEDHSWIVTTMWDDDWTHIGGSQHLINSFLTDSLLGPRTRQVVPDQDATPPGHTAY